MTDHYSSLVVTLKDGVAWVMIKNGPLNLLDKVLLTDLDRLTATLRDDHTTKVIVFESADPDFFVPHGDMAIVDDPSFADWPIALEQNPVLNPMMRLNERIRLLPQVTIAKLRGLARGGGSELVTAMDMRFASLERAGLAQMEAPTGIIPGAGATAYLTRQIGRPRALEIVLGAGLIDARTAEKYGWVNRALPDAELDAFVEDLARRIAALPPGVIDAAVVSIDAALTSFQEGLEVENRMLGELFARPAAAELTRAALKAGAQTRDGERDLEAILQNIAVNADKN
ncbi:enoyl-CoA hydratase/isomerase family protein [Micromonospora chokoriensis]